MRIKRMIKNRIVFLALVIAIVIIAGSAGAATILDNVVEYKLGNGMKFLLLKRGEAPIFTANITFRAGAVDEIDDEAGIAHMVEHMAFKGTKNLGTTNYGEEKKILDRVEEVGKRLSEEYAKGENADQEMVKQLREELKSLHDEESKFIVKDDILNRFSNQGAVGINAATSFDRTSYFESLPTDQMEFWASLESERIFEPVFREFYEERDVVHEEYRARVENNPFGEFSVMLVEKAFLKSPYRRYISGNPKTIRQFTRTKAERFFDRYYDPSNAVGAIVGGIDIPKTKEILNKYFGSIKSRGGVRRASFPEEPMQTERREFSLTKDAGPLLVMAYHKPTIPNHDDDIFDVISTILSVGRTSRFYKKLVLEKKIVSDVDVKSAFPASRLPNLFLIQAFPIPPHTLKDAEAEIEKILGEMGEELVTEEEFQRAKTKIKSSLIWGLKTNSGIAEEVSFYESLIGDWQFLKKYESRIDSITREDVRNTVKKYLRPELATIGYLNKLQ